MFDKIIIRLDGSSAAEMILPYPVGVVCKFNSEINLVSVSDPGPNDTELPIRNSSIISLSRVSTRNTDEPL